MGRSALMGVNWCHSLHLPHCKVTSRALLPVFEYSVASNVSAFSNLILGLAKLSCGGK